MKEQRTRMRIVGDVLVAARDNVVAPGGSPVTQMARHANLSHGRIKKVLATLVAQGLLEQSSSSRACLYRLSGRGREFHAAYRSFSEMAEGFGLSL